jgi:uncharacterized protein (DUF111 family)
MEDIDDLLNAIQQKLEMIIRMNKAIERHQQAQSPVSIIEQYQHLKHEHANQLVELLEHLDLPFDLKVV